MKKYCIFVAVLFLVSCSSTRVNEEIKFKLSAKEAKKEYNKFKLSYLTSSSGQFDSEGAFTSFTMSEFNKKLESISPSTKEQLPTISSKENISWGLYGLWIASIFIKDSNGKRINSLYYAMGFAWFGYTICVVEHYRNKAKDTFNKDLKEKLIPKLSYNILF